ncbi:MAG: Fic family protein [Victivallaceae bacterium]
MTYSPPFKVSAKAIGMVAEISALIERYAIRMEQEDSLRLRKANRIKTIQGSLAIEGNKLSESQITAILDGKQVVAPIREIQEVKNAIAAYDLYPSLNPYSMDDLLKAHNAMMQALIDSPGQFRATGVGVVAGTEVIHMAPPAGRVPQLMADLFNWLRRAEDHLLIKSCAFHYEFEFIHPFADGNGRMGRLWQSLILGQLNPVFEHLPVENMVYANQQGYYQAINQSSAANDCGIFIDFMLNEILQTLKQHQNAEGVGVNVGVNVGVKILEYIKQNPGCRANAIAAAVGITTRTVERHIRDLKERGEIEFRGAPKTGGYFVIASQADKL